MPTLNQLNVNQNNGQLVLSQTTTPVIEALAGQISIDRLMERFPEEVYNRSRDSHLYRLVATLCGESGAGLLKKQSLLARLKNEAGLINFNEIDSFYGQVLNFRRLKREIYVYDPYDESLEKEVWDKIHSMDNSYKKRVVLYLQSTRYGNAPRGIELAAEAASGLEVEVVENYRYLFDQKSDDPLGLLQVGNTEQHEEFVIIPQAIDNRHDVDQTITINLTGAVTGGTVTLYYADLTGVINYGDSPEAVREMIIGSYTDLLRTYEVVKDTSGNIVTVDEAVSSQFFTTEHINVESDNELEYKITVNDPNINIFNFSVSHNLTGTNPGVEMRYPINASFYIAKFSGPNPLYINAVRRGLPLTDALGPWRSENTLLIEPEIERNIVRTVDKIRPAHSVMTVKAQPQTYIRIAANKVQASSERISISRFVTGKPDIDWPTPGDPHAGTFIYGKYVVLDGAGNQSLVSVEREATTIAYNARAIPIVYHTIEAIGAYTNRALTDPDYNTARFFGGSSPTFEKYRSISHAPYGGYTRSRFPSLVALTDSDDIFFDYFALARPNTPFMLDSKAVT